MREDGVLFAGEVVEHLIVGEAAAVKANVENDAFLVEVIGVESADETFESGLGHGGNVDVGELALAEFADAVGVAFDPAFVHQRRR